MKFIPYIGIKTQTCNIHGQGFRQDSQFGGWGGSQNWEGVSGVLHGLYRFFDFDWGVPENLKGGVDTPHRGSFGITDCTHY